MVFCWGLRGFLPRRYSTTSYHQRVKFVWSGLSFLLRVNWKHTIATFKSWRNTTTTSNIRDILLSYVFQHLGPTHRVCIPLTFLYGPYCPSVIRRPSSTLRLLLRVHCPRCRRRSTECAAPAAGAQAAGPAAGGRYSLPQARPGRAIDFCACQ